MKAQINKNYLYDHADIAQLTKHYKLQNTDPNIIWGEAIGVKANQGVLVDGDYSLKKAFDELKPGQKLLLPLNLEKSFHWVGLMIEKYDSGQIIATSMDSLPSDAHEEEIHLALALISSKTGGNIKITQPKKDVLLQPDKTSCGPYTLQNLIQQSSSSSTYTSTEQKETVRNKIRQQQIDLAGDNFRKKQAFKGRQNETWDEITGTQMAVIDSLNYEIKREDGRRSPVSVTYIDSEASIKTTKDAEDTTKATIEFANELGKKIRQGYLERIINVFKKGGWAKNNQIIEEQQWMRKTKYELSHKRNGRTL